MIFNDPKIIAAFSSQPQNMSLNCGVTEGALENRENFLKQLGIDHQGLVCPKQTHSANIRVVEDKDKGKGAVSYDSAIDDTDAFITRQRNLPLAVFTADCLSVFLYDPQTPAIGIVHAGWKGTRLEISAKTVALMQQEFATDPKNLLVAFGPSMKKCCYEVTAEFKDYFTYGLEEKGGRYFLDIPAINRKQLLDSGLREENIFDHSQCTYCNSDKFFSFRRQGQDAGRMMSVIMLKQNAKI